MTPIVTACRKVPRSPTRYAAITVFPCPGASECAAPSPIARRSATTANPGESDRSPTSAVKAAVTRSVPARVTAAPLGVPASDPLPGAVDSRGHPVSGSATLPLGGASQREVALARAASLASNRRVAVRWSRGELSRSSG